MARGPSFLLLLGVFLLAWAADARAELVTLATGRVMSVQSVTFEGDEARLILRNGGEVRCPRSLVAEVAPDEVPHPAPGSDVEAPAADPEVPDLSAAPYAELIERLSNEHRVDPALVHAVVQAESAYRSRARSRRGAMGLMQLMPATARQYGVTDAYDPESNLSAGIQHLKTLLDRYDLREAVAAYNAGEEAVRRFRGVPPYPETRAYVRSVLAALGENR